MTADERSRASGSKRPNPYKLLVETMADGAFILDRTGRITFANGATETFLDLDREAIVGEPFGRVADSGPFNRDARGRFEGAFEAVRDGDDSERRVTIGADGERVLEFRLRAESSGKSADAIVVTVREITQHSKAIETLARQRKALYRLYEADIDREQTVTEKIERALEIGCEFLQMPIGFLASVDGETHRLEYVIGSDNLEAGTERPLESTYCRYALESDDPVAIRDTAALNVDRSAEVETEVSCYIGTKILIDGEVHGTFCFAAADARDRSFSPAEREFARLLGAWAGHLLERQRFETVLRGLHEMGQRLLSADRRRAVAQVGIETASELFDLPIAACWRYDATTDSLRPLAETSAARDVVGETPAFERASGLVWECFEAGAIRAYEALSEESRAYNRATPIESEIHIPLGTRGVLVGGTTDPRSFENLDIESLRLLGDLLTEGLIDVEREEALEERGEALQRQNEQLEEFAHVIAHDLRNPLAGAIGFLEIARETNEKRHFDHVETSLQRMNDLIEKLLDIARGARRAADPRELALIDIVEEAWSYVDAESATLIVGDDLGGLYADETRLLQLFGNLFRNSVEHAGEDVTVEVGALDDGFYVEDDGPGLPDGARADVLTLGRTSSATGIGIGLDSVTDIVEAHGWELSIPETDGGARFEIRAVRSDKLSRTEG